MALVVQVVDPNSDRARRSEGARKAMQDELHKVMSNGTFRFEEVKEWSKVKEEDGEALLMRMRMLLGIKHAEMGPAHYIWKARFIAQGDKVTDVFDQDVVE